MPTKKFTPGVISADLDKMGKIYTRTSNMALNAVIDKAFTKIKAEITADSGIKPGQFATGKKRILFKSKSKVSTLKGSVFATGRRVPIGRMEAKKVKKVGVSFLSKRATRTIIPKAFILKKPGGKLVLKRLEGAAKRLPITEGSYRKNGKSYKERKIKRQPLLKLLGPSIPKIMSRPFMARVMSQLMTEEWPRQYERALRAQISRQR
ncbi:MAG: hypothetical protein GQ468_05380 [Candidatus Scalindua sp.]|nr:hypothetical protein [Candidatus Scalindua sp.]